MKIQVQQRGGFAGVAYMLVDVDSARVSAVQAKELERLAHQVEKVAANRGSAAKKAGADFLTYDITLQDGDRRKTLTVVDDDSPGMAQVRAVLAELSTLAKTPH